MSLKRIFEQPPPSYHESAYGTQHELPQYDPTRSPAVAPLFLVWKRVLTLYLRQAVDEEDEAERCLELLQSFRSVSRLLYGVSMSILRARHITSYLQRIKLPVYATNLSLDSFDLPLRERRVLDHFVAYQVNRASLLQQSSLLLNNEDSETEHQQVDQDLFGWLQPQTFLEDEICKALPPQHSVRFQDVLVRFHYSKAAITLPCQLDSTSRPSAAVFRKEYAGITRPKEEAINITAARLSQELNQLVFARVGHGASMSYQLIGR